MNPWYNNMASYSNPNNRYSNDFDGDDDLFDEDLTQTDLVPDPISISNDSSPNSTSHLSREQTYLRSHQAPSSNINSRINSRSNSLVASTITSPSLARPVPATNSHTPLIYSNDIFEDSDTTINLAKSSRGPPPYEPRAEMIVSPESAPSSRAASRAGSQPGSRVGSISGGSRAPTRSNTITRSKRAPENKSKKSDVIYNVDEFDEDDEDEDLFNNTPEADVKIVHQDSMEDHPGQYTPPQKSTTLSTPMHSPMMSRGDQQFDNSKPSVSFRNRDSHIAPIYNSKRNSTIPQHPQSAYRNSYNKYYGNDYPDYITASPRFPMELGAYGMESVPDLESGIPLRPYSQHITFSGDDYVINTLEDADDDEDIDPFGDDDSLFSENGEEFVRRGATIRRTTTLKKQTKDGAEYDDDFDLKVPKMGYTKTIKKAKLVNGNYVIDCPVPKALLDQYGKKITDSGREMAFMRYTAATCGPSNFKAFNYNVRQALYQPPRSTEIVVCITMYNENEVLLGRTLKGIFENIRDLTKRSDPFWGEESWKKIVICIVADGRVNLNKRTENLLSALGVYQEGYAKSKINNKTVKSHIYEYTTTVGIDTVNDRVHLTSNSNPVQLLFCLKEKNAKKINSHRWVLQGFAPILDPKIVILLDCGTQPANDAFYHLWKSFNDPNVAGACGEMKAALGPGNGLLVNPLVAAQNFEYKISNILDKPMESVFGFITVLPGAFSAYRYEALLNVDGEGPLEKYFKGEFLHQDAFIEDEDDDEKKLKEKNYHEAGIFTSNMYLAEDRILCFELVAKKNHNYVLRYVKDAKAETDVPEKLDEFVLQRRRWLNGSFFAAGYSLFHWTKIWSSDHTLFRKLFLQVEFYYQLITLLVSWFSLASFFLVFRILTANLGAADMNFTVGKYLAVIFLWLYGFCVVCTFVLAFGNTPRGTKRFYTIIVWFFAILMAYMMFAAIFLAVHTVQAVLSEYKGHFHFSLLFLNSKFRDLIVSVVSTYTLYFVGSFLYGEPSFMFTSFVQYVLISPSYVNVLNIYAFCNIHDISWGTKGTVMAKDLGVAKSTGAKKDELVMIAPGVAEELNEKYVNTLESLRVLEPEIIDINSKKKRDDNYYAFVRSITVLIWMVSNFILISVVLKSGGYTVLFNSTSVTSDDVLSGNSGTFLTIILWIVAGLACFRFIGCVCYQITRAFRPLKWRIQSSSFGSGFGNLTHFRKKDVEG